MRWNWCKVNNPVAFTIVAISCLSFKIFILLQSNISYPLRAPQKFVFYKEPIFPQGNFWFSELWRSRMFCEEINYFWRTEFASTGDIYALAYWLSAGRGRKGWWLNYVTRKIHFNPEVLFEHILPDHLSISQSNAVTELSTLIKMSYSCSMWLLSTLNVVTACQSGN